jgi:hypothetical protein
LKRRQDNAREILLDELRQGSKTLDLDEIEEAVAISQRYNRAAMEGAARLNLRLMAQVIAGQAERGKLVADEFLYYADIVASLRREELILIGTLYRHWVSNSSPPLGTSREDLVLQATKSELIPNSFATEDEFIATATATMRTGLVVALSAWGGLVYKPTPLLDKFAALASIEEALDAEPNE